MNLIKSFAVLIFSIVLFSGCYKFNHNFIMKGKWYVNSFEVNGGSINLMQDVLPGYEQGKSNYIVYMLDNGILRGEYYTNDTLVYYRTGYWNMPHKDSIYFKFDVFVDGTFYMEQADNNSFLLSTAANDIEFFNIGKVPAVMRISRGEYIDPATTTP